AEFVAKVRVLAIRSLHFTSIFFKITSFKLKLEMAVDGNSFEVTPETEKFLCERLLDQTQPISERFRVLFSLRNLRGPAPRNALILEALGAIGLESNIPLLKDSLDSDPAQEVRETCELALSRIQELKNAGDNHQSSTTAASPFLSVDPAAPASCSSVHKLREVILNEEKGMYERYGALFGLRNHGGDEAVAAVAYVLGQLQNKSASDALSRILKDVNEHPMVRHEAAEALGSIADDQCISLLEEFSKDPEPIVSQSCEVALSMLDFERSGKSFEVIQDMIK
ncbi:Armadillo-like helical, partial [Cynara cardunculus var. scolymus]